jgi:hypothetical protein
MKIYQQVQKLIGWHRQTQTVRSSHMRISIFGKQAERNVISDEVVISSSFINVVTSWWLQMALSTALTAIIACSKHIRPFEGSQRMSLG